MLICVLQAGAAQAQIAEVTVARYNASNNFKTLS